MQATDILSWAPIFGSVALIAVAVIQRRHTRVEKESSAVDIMSEVAGQLRAELQRKKEDTQQALISAANTIKRQDDEIEMLRDELLQSRKSERSAHEVSGRAMRRVIYLENILRDHDIVYDPGPLA